MTHSIIFNSLKIVLKQIVYVFQHVIQEGPGPYLGFLLIHFWDAHFPEKLVMLILNKFQCFSEMHTKGGNIPLYD